MNFLIRACSLIAALCAPALAAGQSFPSKSLRIVVPITPGSATDIIARTLGEQMHTKLGVPVVVENRPGAGTTIGSAAVAKSPPDGYTLLVNSTAHTANPWMYAQLPYDSVKDFTPVTSFANLPNVLVVSTSAPWKSLQELLATVKANSGSAITPPRASAAGPT
jgi:tripartite-type tricarboxylate transporter receptor subunit TctC